MVLPKYIPRFCSPSFVTTLKSSRHLYVIATRRGTSLIESYSSVKSILGNYVVDFLNCPVPVNIYDTDSGMKKGLGIVYQVIIGFLLADIITGSFHWFEDTYLDYCVDLPFIGDIAKDNELHHYFPRSMLAYSYYDNVTVSLPAIIIMLIIIYLVDKSLFVKYPYLIATFSLVACVANIIHKFSHMRDCEKSWGLNLLQKSGILASGEHHKLHHKLSTEKYCVITEFNNFYLDRLYFWRGLESIIYALTGIKPNRKMGYDEYREIHNYMHENAKLECPDKPTMRDVEILIEKLREYKACAVK